MNDHKMGELIKRKRMDKGWTQLALANALHISDKTVSKWERNQGLPDLTMIPLISEVLEINANELLTGDQQDHSNQGGNMKRTKFYVCPICGNVLTSTNEILLSCCGQKLEALQAKAIDEAHVGDVEVIEDDTYITFNHEMSKLHYISFVAYVTMDRLYVHKLYPEQNPEVRFQKRGRGIIYLYCSQDGLMILK